MFLGADAVGYDIWVLNVNGPGPTNVTNGAERVGSPEWSPDGMSITYTRDDGGNNEIYRIGADGTNPINLTNLVGADFRARWSPDGTQIVFQHQGANAGIYVMDAADGSNQMLVGSGDEYEWSPDGTKIVFNGGGSIRVVNPDGTGLITLTGPASGGRKSQPSWSPDGTKIAFTNDFNDKEIYVTNADGTSHVGWWPVQTW